MGRYIAAISDSHGNYAKVDRMLSSLPHGTYTYFMGDMMGPSDRSFTEGIKHSVEGSSEKNRYGGYLGELYRQGQEQTPAHRRFVSDAHNDTKGTIDVILRHSARTPVAAATPGNNEKYQHELWKSYKTELESPDTLFRKSALPYVEKPVVHFYKNGVLINRMIGGLPEDAGAGRNLRIDADMAVIVLPYIAPKDLEERIAAMTGKSAGGGDKLREAIYEILKDGGIIDQIRAYNPKHVVQLQHENPSPRNFERFGTPYLAEDQALYDVVMREVSALKKSRGSRIGKHLIVYGHIEHGGTFRQRISFEGSQIDTLHVDEGNDAAIIDTVTGEVYSLSEQPDYADKEAEIAIVAGQETAGGPEGPEAIVSEDSAGDSE
jgi:hypothetical protein